MGRRALPMPEVLRPVGHAWVVVDSGMNMAATTDVDNGRVLLPCDEHSPKARAARMHEKLHMLWTPSKADTRGVSFDVINAVEDLRLGYRAEGMLDAEAKAVIKYTRMFTDEVCRGIVDAAISSDVAHRGKGVRNLVLALTCSTFCNDGRQLRREAQRYVDLESYTTVDGRPITMAQRAVLGQALRLAKEAAGRMSRYPSGRNRPAEKATYKTGLKVAQWLEEQLTQRQNAAIDTAVAEQKMLDMLDGDKIPWGDEPSLPPRDDITLDADWGEMEVTEPTRPVVLSPGKGLHKLRFKPSDQGDVFRYPHRWPLDRKVFSSRRKLPGGTILFDVSGSMQIEPQMIEELVAALPDALIAVYCGRGGYGELRVICKRRRRVMDDELRPTMGFNIIDGPALTWLAAQPKPRAWVSDGEVRGRHHTYSDQLILDCTRICADHNIRRFDTHTDLIEFVSGPSR